MISYNKKIQNIIDLAKNGEPNKALALLYAMNLNNPGDYHRARAHVFSAAGKQFQARKEFERAAEVSNRSVDVLIDYAIFLKDIGDFQTAIMLSKEAISQGDDYGLYIMGRTYYASGDLESAIKAYEAAVQNGIVNAMFNLANAYEAIGNDKAAIDWFTQCVQRGDEDAEVRLAEVYLRRKIASNEDLPPLPYEWYLEGCKQLNEVAESIGE